MQRSCQTCHREHGSAPFSLTRYEQARAVAADIVELTRSRTMPPWKADGPIGRFVGDRRLPARDIATLEGWFAGGLEKGDPADAPPPVEWSEGWTSRPTHIASLESPYHVSAEGPDEYVWLVIPSGLEQDRLLKRVEIRPSPAQVVHHLIAYTDSSGRARELDAADPRPGYRRLGDPGFAPDATLAGWAPGATSYDLPRGYARPVKAGSDIVVEVHLVKRGRAVAFDLDIGLTFANEDEEPIRRHVVTFALNKMDIAIPANAARHVEESTSPVPITIELLAMSPHMHVLGRSIELAAVSGAGGESTLIRIPDWDFGWQSQYVFPRPHVIEGGSQLRLRAAFDNSAANPLNPNTPPRDVRWGPNAADEMLLILLDLAIPADPFIRSPEIRKHLGLPPSR